MIRAIIQNGAIQPLDPLPADWRDGHELIIEEAETVSPGDLDDWKRELQRLGPAQYEPGEWERVQVVLTQADAEAKALVRREMASD